MQILCINKKKKKKRWKPKAKTLKLSISDRKANFLPTDIEGSLCIYLYPRMWHPSVPWWHSVYSCCLSFLARPKLLLGEQFNDCSYFKKERWSVDKYMHGVAVQENPTSLKSLKFQVQTIIYTSMHLHKVI